MKKNEKKVIFTIVGILVIVLLIVLIIRGAQKKQPQPSAKPNEQQNVVEDEFAEKRPDGSRVNTSKKFAQTRTLDGLEISNIRAKEQGNTTQFLADVTNKTSELKEGMPVTLYILDKNGNVIEDLPTYIDRVAPGETVVINASSSSDFANAYDFRIEK